MNALHSAQARRSRTLRSTSCTPGGARDDDRARIDGRPRQMWGGSEPRHGARCPAHAGGGGAAPFRNPFVRGPRLTRNGASRSDHDTALALTDPPPVSAQLGCTTIPRGPTPERRTCKQPDRIETLSRKSLALLGTLVLTSAMAYAGGGGVAVIPGTYEFQKDGGGSAGKGTFKTTSGGKHTLEGGGREYTRNDPPGDGQYQDDADPRKTICVVYDSEDTRFEYTEKLNGEANYTGWLQP